MCRPSRPPPPPPLVSRRWYRCHVDLSSFLPAADGLPRLGEAEGAALTPQAFEARFDAPRQPVVAAGLLGGWAPLRDWAPAALGARYGEREVRVSKPLAASGRSARMRLDAYLQYAAVQADEEPLYVFDS